ncbi:MAG: hypothetical protein AB7S36_16815, partial [Planctomycetota bacterium]
LRRERDLKAARRFGRVNGTIVGILLIVACVMPGVPVALATKLVAKEQRILFALGAENSGLPLTAIAFLGAAVLAIVGAWFVAPHRRWMVFMPAVLLLIGLIAVPAMLGARPAIGQPLSTIVVGSWSYWAAAFAGVLLLLGSLRILMVVPALLVPRIIAGAIAIGLVVLLLLPIVPYSSQTWVGTDLMTRAEAAAWFATQRRPTGSATTPPPPLPPVSITQYSIGEMRPRNFIPLVVVSSAYIVALFVLVMLVRRRYRRSMAIGSIWLASLLAFTVPLGLLLKFGFQGVDLASILAIVRGYIVLYALSGVLLLAVVDAVLARWVTLTALQFSATAAPDETPPTNPRASPSAD